MTVYEVVTNKIIEKLDKGVVPWSKGFSTPWGIARNWQTMRPYRGVNMLLTDYGAQYLTFKQAEQAGGTIKKGTKSDFVTFFTWFDAKDDDGNPLLNKRGEQKQVPCLRYYRVFNVEDVDGVELKPVNKDIKPIDHDPIEVCEEIVKGYPNAPKIRIREALRCARYVIADDEVLVPNMHWYKDAEMYYSTLFHELIHSTGHESRLARSGVTDITIVKGDKEYAREELTAEIGAAMLMEYAGFLDYTIDNTASYIKHWKDVLKDDSKAIVYAASRAEKACKYILQNKMIA